MVINRLVNLFKRNKEWDQAYKYKKFGVRRDKPDERDYIWENRLQNKNVKCDYYKGREKVENK